MQTPRFISSDEVEQIHADQIASFGGTPGIRDPGLLESALAQPQASFGGQLLHPTIAEQAAAYLFHLAMNHPFIDGNKRTAFAVMDTFLRLNGYSLDLADQQAYELVMQVVEGGLDKTALSLRLQSALGLGD
ncbi:MAG: type II toxin-antitoxin system death-on-curing family toxin [Leptolyngbya sp. IPPAS B-1204]|nr:MAG: type II toxin-antitoxin system death-on-curing family toxin [Leptolyngbya sp. IPPAS B-1204]